MSARRFVKSSVRRRKQSQIVVTFLCLACVAIVCGYFLGRYFIHRTISVPVLTSPNTGTENPIQSLEPPDTNISPNSPDTATSSTLDFSTGSIQFYQVQVGAFQTAENGRALVCELADNGVAGGTVVFIPPYYRVRVGLLSSRDEAENLVVGLQQLEYEGFIVQRTISHNYSIKGDDEYLQAVKASINACSDLINQLVNMDFGGVNNVTTSQAEQVKQRINSLEEKCKILENLTPPSTFASAHEQIVNAVKIVKQVADLDTADNYSKLVEFVELYSTFRQ